MSQNGAGNTHNLATRVSYKEISATETDCDARWLHGKQKLEAALAARPHLRIVALMLFNSGLKDPWAILYRLRLANQQFTFRNGVNPAKKGPIPKIKRDHSVEILMERGQRAVLNSAKTPDIR
jgi:hypothetical protein